MAREHTGAWSASGQAELENRIVLLQAGLEIYEILKRQAGQKKLQPFKGKEGAAKAVREKAKRE